MKKARAPRDCGLPKRAALPPPLPSFDELDALAASGTPTVESAWWISHQVSEHVFSMVAHSDPRTGEPLPRPLTEILRDLRDASATGSRPFPRDRLVIAAEFAADALEHLLDRHRHRIVRVHEQIPFHQLREVDTRSMAWLARQPGRSIREKLSGRTHALGVKRDVSADTTENRLLRSFAKLLVQRASNRLAYKSAYDGTAADSERVRCLDDCMLLCDERMRRSELAEVPTLARLLPNNVLLGDTHYSRVFRAWKWLRADEEALRGSWKDALQRARVLLFWMVAAQIAVRERVVIAETLGRVLAGHDDDHSLGVQVLGADAVDSDWTLNPPLYFVVLPAGHDDAAFRIRISLEGEFILAHIATLGGRSILREESVSALSFEVRPTSERLHPQRGVGISIDGIEISPRGAECAHADLAGLNPLSKQMARQILQRCDVNPNIEKREQAGVVVKAGARLGIELGNACLHVCADQAIPLMTCSWALALELPGDTSGFEWIDGRVEREIVVGASGRSLWTSGDVLNAGEHVDAGMLALAADRMLATLSSELAAPADATVAYAVPDAVDEFSQRSLRSAFGASFHRPVPVWRSVAAAMAWTATAGERGPRSGESVVVVDMEFAGVSLTLLTARYDEKLAQMHPTSRGIYWERRPPLPPDERLEMLGWPHVLRAYARMLVSREFAALGSERKQGLVEDLVRSGRIASLVAQGGSIFLQVPSSQHATPDVVEFFEDPAWLDDEVGRWVERLDRCVQEALAPLGASRAVFIGGPCSYERFGRLGSQTGRIKFFNEAKGFGFIVPDGGGDKLYFNASAWSSARRPNSSDHVQFEVGNGRMGPEARGVGSVPRMQEWLRRRTFVAPQGLPSGARECLLRLDTGSLTWREWVPELSLEVVRDGHYRELPLLTKGTFVDPFLGSDVHFTVPETLTLARGQPWFSFPLLVGRQGGRPFAWEARLESKAFPLNHDVRARLKLSYRYGLDNSYMLAVEPETGEDAPFSRIDARWIRGGEAMSEHGSRETPVFDLGTWAARDEERFPGVVRSFLGLDDADLERVLAAIHRPSRADRDAVEWQERKARALFGVTKGCWSQGRSVSSAGAGVRNVFPEFRDGLLAVMDRLPGALDLLVLLHEDATPEVVLRVLETDHQAAANVGAYRRSASMTASLVGDGTGARSPLLALMIERLRRHLYPFDPALVEVTMRAFGTAVWRHPRFIHSLAAVPGAVAELLERCQRSLQWLLANVPAVISSDKELVRYGVPFRDACELLLALLRIDPSEPSVVPLRCGSSSADALAKTIRRLDARFLPCSEADSGIHWRVHLNVSVPPELKRMSPVAFALNRYLAIGAGTNLVQIAKVDLD